ncbi:hypothetical protein CRM22_006544 [Opisthorchis felineus]|uniref:Uncharacterized protein n=1 Tax=Opisthorchis felineus TaxID=147828 RepID=A0A4V3SED0_OPIFE|nr:hypothetical protein CRM22_006544 [Opisthorchis felineus]
MSVVETKTVYAIQDKHLTENLRQTHELVKHPTSSFFLLDGARSRVQLADLLTIHSRHGTTANPHIVVSIRHPTEQHQA